MSIICSYIRSLKIASRTYRYGNMPGMPSSTASCFQCLQLQLSNIHTSTPMSAARPGKTKKKIIKPIRMSSEHKKRRKDMETVEIFRNMTVKELGAVLERDADHVLRAFEGMVGTQNYRNAGSAIDNLEIIKKVVTLSGYRFKLKEAVKTDETVDKDVYPRPPPAKCDLVKRPPVVTIMGHVDHGKTTLLDTLRHSNVVSQEFGGITQHIGAFTVKLDSGEEITFLDTPGHAAFHAMRSRGAHVTDIVVLVVAADDGVMKQTIESIHHSQDAKVPIIVAVNKIDKPGADIEATKRTLIQSGLEIEDYGGDIQVIPVSALKGTNLDDLKEAIVALAEILEIGGDPTGPVEASVVESSTDAQRGKLCTILIQRGTLKRGAILLAGEALGKVRAMFDASGKPIAEAKPGTAVEMLGWKELPHAGQCILQLDSEKRAHEIIAHRKHLSMSVKADLDMAVYNTKMEAHDKEYNELRAASLGRGRKRNHIYRSMRKKEIIDEHVGPQLCIVIKGDVDGSVEAILDSLDTYQSDKCRLHILSYGVGDVAPHDVEMAANFNGNIYAFNTSLAPGAKLLADQKGVSIHKHNVIYKMIDDLKDELQLKMPSVEKEEIVGRANVLALFTVSEGKNRIPVIGCRCTKGVLHKKQHFRLERNGDILHAGALHSLKHLKSEVESIKTDVECGISFKDSTIVAKPGDDIVCYTFKEVPQTLEWELDF